MQPVLFLLLLPDCFQLFLLLLITSPSLYPLFLFASPTVFQKEKPSIFFTFFHFRGSVAALPLIFCLWSRLQPCLSFGILSHCHRLRSRCRLCCLFFLLSNQVIHYNSLLIILLSLMVNLFFLFRIFGSIGMMFLIFLQFLLMFCRYLLLNLLIFGNMAFFSPFFLYVYTKIISYLAITLDFIALFGYTYYIAK